MASRLKYFSIKLLMPGPNFLNRAATRKKRSDLLKAEAVRKTRKLSLNTPEAIVKTL